MTVKVGFVFAMIAILFIGCDKDKSYPETPALEYLRSEALPADVLAHVMHFQDGDGDIGSKEDGVDDADACPEKDLQYRYYEMVDGSWTYVPLLNEGYCVESMTPEGQDKTLEGDIIARIPRFIQEGPGSDSVRIGFRLRDRAGHISNEVFSSLIINE